MPKFIQKLDNVFYPETTRYWDDERFAADVRARMKSSYRVLDYGAGRGKNPMLDFRDVAGFVVGVDVDSGILENKIVDECHAIGIDEDLPFADETFDVVYSCNVLEHLNAPETQLREIARVLKQGGVFVAKTTNRTHYVSLIARLTPQRFHRWYNSLRGRDEVDTFPTWYRCNSARQILNVAGSVGLEVEYLDYWEWRPEYLRITVPSYLVGIAYERLVNSVGFLRRFRAVISVGMRRQCD